MVLFLPGVIPAMVCLCAYIAVAASCMGVNEPIVEFGVTAALLNGIEMGSDADGSPAA